MFAKVLKMLRVSNDLTIKELAEKTGISASYISDLENGRKKEPSIEIIQKYSEALNVSIDTIVYFTKEAKGKQWEYQKMLYELLCRLVKE